MRIGYSRGLGLCASALLVSGCFGARARSVSVVPLDMPAPPPRVVEVSTPEAPPIVSVPEAPIRATPSQPRPPSPPPSGTPRVVDTPRTDAVTDPPKPADDASRPASTTLQTTSSEQGGAVERRILGLLAQATTDLGRINYQGLDADARTQYDTARRFIGQADEALRGRNLVFASNLSEKAAALAAQLVGR